MLTLFALEKEAALPKEIRDIERMASARDEIEEILRDVRPAELPELPDRRIYISQRQF